MATVSKPEIRGMSGLTLPKADGYGDYLKKGENGSIQQNFVNRMATGEPLSGDEILQAKHFAGSQGLALDATTGYRQAPQVAQAPSGGGGGMNRLSNAGIQSSGGIRPTGGLGGGGASRNIPSDVRAIQLMGGPKTEKQAKRLARFESSTLGKRMAAKESEVSSLEDQTLDRGGRRNSVGGYRPQIKFNPQDNSLSNNEPAGVTSGGVLRSEPSAGRENKYAKNLGAAWGRTDAVKYAGMSDAERQAEKAGISVSRRNELVAAGQKRLDNFKKNRLPSLTGRNRELAKDASKNATKNEKELV